MKDDNKLSTISKPIFSEIQIYSRANTGLKMIEIGLGAKEEEASNADRSHQPCAHSQDYTNYEKRKKL